MNIKFVSKPLIIAATATSVVAGLGTYVWRQEHRPPLLEVYLFALKNGQATFIRTPDDKRILIDGGGNAEIVRHLSKLLPFYSRRIDTVIVTNPLAKHVSGLVDIIDRYTVDRSYIPSVTLQSLGLASSTDRVFETFLDSLRDHKVSLQQLKAGDTIELGNKVDGKILFPASPEDFAYSKASGPQMVMDISYGETSALLLGDVTKKIQKHIATMDMDQKAQKALVVSNTGAPDDLSSELFNLYAPDFFMYSKKTSYSAPKPTASKKKIPPDSLQAILGDQRFNIIESGVIKIVSDGKSLTISEEK